MAGKKNLWEPWLVVHLGRWFMINNYCGVQEGLTCVVGTGKEVIAHESVTA